MTNQYHPTLADGPITDEIHVYHNSEWARTFDIRNVETREILNNSDLSFYGTVSYNDVVVATFQFTKPNSEDISVKLPVNQINLLDASKCYDYDWLVVTGNDREVFAKSKLRKFQTATVVP